MNHFSLGVEEELFIGQAAGGRLWAEPPSCLLAAARDAFGERLSLESLRCQLEIKTGICADFTALRQEMAADRAQLAALARRFDSRILATGLPAAEDWRLMTRHDNAQVVERCRDYGLLFFRGITGAFHLHVGLADNDLRTEIAYLCAPYLPLLAALSGNSPLFGGEDTGLLGYRLSLINSRPRSGNFPAVSGFGEYQNIRDQFTRIIREAALPAASNASYRHLGYVRPNHRYQTLEFRLFDGNPRLADVLPVFALAACLVWAIAADPDKYRRQRRHFSEEWLEQNMWQALSHGVQAGFFLPQDSGATQIMAVREWLEVLDEDLVPAAQALGCTMLLADCTRLAQANAMAALQLHCFSTARAKGLSAEEAGAVVSLALMDQFETA